MQEKQKHIVFQVLNFIKHPDNSHALTLVERLLLLILLSNDYGQGIFPSIDKLCSQMGLTKWPIIRALKSLEEKKLLKIEKSNGRGNQYFLSINEPTSSSAATGSSVATGSSPAPELVAGQHQTSSSPATLYNNINNNLNNIKDIVHEHKENTHPMSTENARCRFEDFWQTYPRKENKKKAFEIWKRKKLNAIADLLIADVQVRETKHQSWLEGFIPHATTYLNGERWNDEIKEQRNGRPHQQSGGKQYETRSKAEQYSEMVFKTLGIGEEGNDGFEIDISPEVQKLLPH